MTTQTKPVQKIKYSIEAIEKGLNIQPIVIEPFQIMNNEYKFQDTNYEFQDGEDFGLTCSLTVYCDDSYRKEVEIDNLVLVDMDSNIVPLSSSQIKYLKSEIEYNISIGSLQPYETQFDY